MFLPARKHSAVWFGGKRKASSTPGESGRVFSYLLMLSQMRRTVRSRPEGQGARSLKLEPGQILRASVLHGYRQTPERKDAQMGDTGDKAAAGWFHAEGDPPGTQRYWDGGAWQGEPTSTPSPQPPAPQTPPPPTASDRIPEHRSDAVIRHAKTTFRWVNVVCVAITGLLFLIPNEAIGGGGSIAIGLGLFAYAAWIGSGRSYYWTPLLYLSPFVAALLVFGG